MLNHYKYERVAEATETRALRSFLRHISVIQPQITDLQAHGLGTEWYDLAASTWRRDGASNNFGLSPRTSTRMTFERSCLTKLHISACSLHDVVWFIPIFKGLKEIELERFTARHLAEVELFALTLNRQSYPSLKILRLTASRLFPAEYLPLFAAIRDHGSIERIDVQGVHVDCQVSSVGLRLNFQSVTAKASETAMCVQLWNYIYSTQTCITYEWMTMFREAGKFDSTVFHLLEYILNFETGCPHHTI